MTNARTSAKAGGETSAASLDPPFVVGDRGATPQNLETFLPLLINQISERITKSYTKAIEDYGLRLVDCRVMRAVDRLGNARLRDIATMSGVDLSTLCRLVRRLIDKGILSMSFRGPTRRADIVALTARGSRIFGELLEIGARHESSLLLGLDNEAVATCLSALNTISDNVGDEWRSVVPSRSADSGLP